MLNLSKGGNIAKEASGVTEFSIGYSNSSKCRVWRLDIY